MILQLQHTNHAMLQAILTVLHPLHIFDGTFSKRVGALPSPINVKGDVTAKSCGLENVCRTS